MTPAQHLLIGGLPTTSNKAPSWWSLPEVDKELRSWLDGHVGGVLP